jgi:parallel beta-helix repeat protein
VASGTHTFTWVVGLHTNNANYVAVDDITVTNSGSGTAALFNGGNVGIGTSFPNATLDVAGTTLFHPTTDGANAFQLQNSTGLNVLAANTSTGGITLGNITSTAGAGLAGSLVFADGTNDNFGATLNTTTLTANRTITLGNESGTICIQSSTNCGFATSTGSGNYIQNQNAAQQASANFWISGIGRADTALQAPTFDTATAVALNIGTTNATGINLNQNTTLAAGKSLTITGGATATRPASPTEGMLYYDTTTKQLLVYANGKWQADRSSATKVVGTSAAGGTSGAIASQNADGADYVNTSTTSAQTTINSAITSLGSTGGTVYLMEGTYVIDGTITIDRNDVRIVGAGAGTIIKIKNGTNASMNVFINSNTYAGMTFSNFTIDGNKANNSAGTQNGIVVNNGGDSSRHSLDVNNITVKNLRNESIVTGGNDYTTISNSHFLVNDGGALNIGSTHMVVSSNTITSNAYGMQISGAGASIIGNQIKTTLSSGTGIYVPSNYATISNNVVDGALAYGIYLSGSNNIVSNNQVLNSSSTGVITGVSNANNTIMNNMISGNGGDGVYLNTATTNSIVDGNRIINSGGHGVHAEGTGHQITNNNITDNGGATYAIYSVGTATIGNNTYSGTGSATINVSANTVFSSQLTPTNFLQSSSSIIKANASSSLTGTAAIAGTTTITGTSTLFLSQLEIGDRVTINSETRTISAISSDTSATVSSAFTTTASAQTVTRLPAAMLIRNSAGTNILTVDDSGALSTVATINSDAGYKINGTAGSSVTCSGGNFLQNMVVSGGIVTGGTCAAGGGSGVTTVGAIDGGTYSANGASISGTTIYLQTASATQVGLVNTGAQTFAGNKTIRGALGVDTATATDDKITLSVTTGGVASFAGNITAADLTAGRTYTLPDASGTFAVSASGNIALSATGNISLTGQVPIANGGTGASTAQGAINALSGLTTMGDLLYNDGTNSTRLARGTNGQCLTSNATTVAWGSCGITSEADTLATVTARGATTSTAVLLQGGATVRGLTIDTATATDDKIAVSVTTGGAASFTGTITSADLTAARTWTLPDADGTFCLQGSASCGFAPTTGGTGYIQNQSASQQATSNFWISGTGRADTALQAPAIDSTGATLTLGGTNATSISVVDNVSLATGVSLTVNGDTRANITANIPSPTEGMMVYDTTNKQLMIFQNGKWQADRSTSTKIVGTSAAGGTSGAIASVGYDGADYVNTSTTSAQTTIATAINNLPATGGTVYLMEGTYIIDSAIVPTKSNFTLVGSGRGTILKLKNGINANINLIDMTIGNGISGATYRNMTLDGNKANNTSGTQQGMYQWGTVASTPGVTIDGVVFQNFRNVGAYIYNTKNSNVSNSAFISNDDTGLYMQATTQSRVVNNNATSNTNYGMYLSADGGNATGNTLESNGTGMAIWGDSKGFTVTGNYIGSSASVGFSASPVNVTFSGNTVNGTTSGNGVVVGSNDIVTGNIITGAGTNGVYMSGSACNNTVSNNRISNSGTGTASSSGIATTCAFNKFTDNIISDTAGTGYAISISNFGGWPYQNYLSNNRYFGTGASSISDGGFQTIYVNQADANGNIINKGNTALTFGTTTVNGTFSLQGGMTTAALGTPAAPSVGTNGPTGTASYTYAITALDGTGETLASAGATIANGFTPLDGTHYNNVTWTRIDGATSYKIYRTAVSAGGSPATTGLIGTVTASNANNGQTNSVTQTFSDTGIAASGSTPAANTTGGASLAGSLQGTSATLTGTSSLTVGTSSSKTGSIIFKNSTNANAITLISGVATAARTVTIGDESGTICLQNSANCGFAVGTAASYIQNTLSQQASSNFWISGTGRADTALQSPALDSTGATLTLGGTNATSISVVDNVTLAAGLSLTVTGGNTASRPAGTDGMVYYDTDTKQLLVYNAGTSKWQADRSDSVLVAASNSSAADKAAADYVADGNTAAAADGDQVQINAALTAAAGKKVVLLPGTYVADATILVPNNTILAGVGNSTVIELADLDVTETLIESSDATTGTGVVIRDMKLDGRNDLNTAGNQSGITMTNMGDTASSRMGGTVTNVSFTRFRREALWIQDSDYTKITNNTVTGGGNGLAIYGTASDHNTISGNKLMAIVGDAFSLYGNYGTVTGNTVTNSTQQATSYYLGGSYYTFTGNTSKGNVTGVTIEGLYNTVSGNSMIGNGDGIYVTTNGSATTPTTGNVISNNVVQGSTSVAPSAGITIYAHSGETVTGNSISGGAGPGIKLVGSGASYPSNNNLISGNTLKDNGGSTTNDAIYLGADADNNTITNNSITDSSATTNNYAINISSATDDTTYLADNTYTSGSVRDTGTGTIQAGQVNSSGNYLLQPAGTIELLKNTNVTGTLQASTSVVTNLLQSNGANGIDVKSNAGNTSFCFTNGGLAINISCASAPSSVGLYVAPYQFNNVAMIVHGASGQTSNLLELQNNGGGILSRFNANGDLLVGGTSASNSTSAFQVQNSAGAAFLTADTTNNKLTVRASNDSSSVSATDLFASSGFAASTGWSSISGTGTAATASHTNGSGTTGLTITPAITPVVGTTYEVTFNITGYTSGSVFPSLGGTYGTVYSAAGTGLKSTIRPSGTGSLVFYPTNDFAGTVTGVTVKPYIDLNPSLNIANNSGTTVLEVRATSNASTFVGIESGKVSTGGNNTGFGGYALQNVVGGSDNTGIGQSAIYNVSTGSYNTAVGSINMAHLRNGSDNTSIGYWTMDGLAKGSQNVSLGNYTGYYAGDSTANTYIGYSSGAWDGSTGFNNVAGLQNATAIGANSIAQASNTLILGSVGSNTKVGIGTTIPDSLFSVSPMVYNTGTAGTAGASSTTVTGVGTSWLTSGLVKVGMKLIFADGQSGTINSVASDTSIVLATAVNEAAGQKYRIHATGFQVTSSGDTYVQKTSTAAFQVKDAGATNLLNIDSSGLKVTVGSTTTDANAVLLSLDSYNNATDPTGVTGAMYYNSATGNFRCYQEGAWQNCMGGGLYSTTADSTTINGSTVGSQTLNTSYTMPANYCTAGRVIHLSAGGVTSSTTTAQPISFAVAIGGTVIGTTAATYTPTNNQTNDAWWIDYTFTCRAAPSASSAVYGQGIVTTQLTPTSTGVVTPIVPSNFAGVNVATNASAAITLNVTYTGTTSASNTLTLKQLLINGY